jgi:hypothetical protein
VSDDVMGKYFALLCQFEPTSVLSFLKAQNNYRLDECLELCRKYGILDACSFLLERAGDIPGAINLYLDQLKAQQVELRKRLVFEAKRIDEHGQFDNLLDSFELVHIGSLRRRTRSSAAKPVKSLPKIKGADVTDLTESVQVQYTLELAIRMIQRAVDNSILNNDEVIQVWFLILDDFVRPLRELRQGYSGQLVATDSLATSYRKMESNHHDDDSDSSFSGEDDENQTPQEHLLELQKTIEKLREKINMTERAISHEFDTNRTNELSAALSKSNKKLKHTMVAHQDAQQRVLEYEKEKTRIAGDPLAAHNISKLANLWLQRVLAKCVRFIYEEMMGYVKLEEILDITTRRYRRDEYGHFKEPVLDVYEKFAYENMLYHSIKGLIDKDNFWLHYNFINKQRRGVRPLSKACFICSNSLIEITDDDSEDNDGEIKIFNCGHSFHIRCLDNMNVETCTICNTKKQQKQQQKGQQPQQQQQRDRPLSLRKKQRMRRVEMQLQSQSSHIDLLAVVDEIQPSYSLEELYNSQRLRTSKVPPPREDERIQMVTNADILPKTPKEHGDLVANFDDFFN